MPTYKTGRLPARHDARVMRLSALADKLPPPPANADWMADVPEWFMLSNDQYGDCVWAAMLHYVWQQSCYSNPGNGLVPTDAEVLAAYASTGFKPDDPTTDNGTFVSGPGGALEYWAKTGIVCGGVLNKVSAYMALDVANPTEWQQGIDIFSGLMVGIKMPTRILEADILPFVWDDPSGPYSGLHEIFLPAYRTVGGARMYDAITWGVPVRITEDCLRGLIDEAVCLYDSASLNANKVNAAGINEATLLDSMRRIHA